MNSIIELDPELSWEFERQKRSDFLRKLELDSRTDISFKGYFEALRNEELLLSISSFLESRVTL